MRGCREPGYFVRLFMLFLLVMGASGILAFQAVDAKPELKADQDRDIQMARPTWDTDWFQAEIFRLLLQEMGYSVAKIRTYENQAFYQTLAMGQVDFWLSGWFPVHRHFFTPEIQAAVELVGYPLQGQVLQGFIVDKASADRLKITSFLDLKRPEVAKHFDINGNGKADLLGCDRHWGCYPVVEYLLQAHQLNATVEQISQHYTRLAHQALKRFQNGQPVLIQAWSPHWLVGQMAPGEGSYWLPFSSEKLPDQPGFKEANTTLELPGCLASPCIMGLPLIDIRGVANRSFLKQYPDIAQLLSDFQISRDEVARQNARMIQGEGGIQHMRTHAQEWIARHRNQVDRWLEVAQKLKSAPQRIIPDSVPLSQSAEKPLRVVTQRLEPFVFVQPTQLEGFSIELWEALAKELGRPFEWDVVASEAKLLDEVERGAADVGIAGLTITSQREAYLNFALSYFESGLQILIRNEDVSLFKIVLNLIFSPKFLWFMGSFALLLLVVAHIIWLLEKKHNDDFPTTYLAGIWEALWWTMVTLTTVGYGDKTPRQPAGKFFAMLWMLSGYFVFAYFTATVTTTFTLQALEKQIKGPEDLAGKKVVTVKNSIAEDYLIDLGVFPTTVDDIEAAYTLLENQTVDALVYHAPILRYYVGHEGKGKVKLAGPHFYQHKYGIALNENSDLLEPINISLLKLIENGSYAAIYQRWFGH